MQISEFINKVLLEHSHPVCLKNGLGTFLVVQWLGFCASTAGGCRFDPWSGNLGATRYGKKKIFLTVYNWFCSTSAEMKSRPANLKYLLPGSLQKKLATTLSWSLVCVLCIEHACNWLELTVSFHYPPRVKVACLNMEIVIFFLPWEFKRWGSLHIWV